MSDKLWNWIWLIGLILGPLIIIHSAGNETLPRLVSTMLIFVTLPVVLLLALSPNQKPASSAPGLRGKYTDATLRKLDVVVKVFALVMASLIFFFLTLPLLRGAYRFFINQEPLVIVEGAVKNQQSVVGAVFLYWRFDIRETNAHYIFYYPNTIRSTGEKYRFAILPGTNFVLDSKETK